MRVRSGYVTPFAMHTSSGCRLMKRVEIFQVAEDKKDEETMGRPDIALLTWVHTSSQPKERKSGMTAE